MRWVRRQAEQQNWNPKNLDRAFWAVACLLMAVQGIGILGNTDAGVHQFVPQITNGIVSASAYGLAFFGGSMYALGLGGHRSQRARTVILSLILIHFLVYTTILLSKENYSTSPIVLYALAGLAIMYITARIPTDA